jgi:hypothetical protein
MRLTRSRATGLSVTTLVATLAIVSACDKAPDQNVNQVLPIGVAELDLKSNPRIIFQVFGDATSPKIMPIATVIDGAVAPIGLTRAGWRTFDSTFFAPGTKYNVFNDDAPSGSVTVTRGMWATGDTALYPLPGCTELRPLGAVTLEVARRSNEPTVELIATSFTPVPHPGTPKPFPPTATIAKMGRDFGLAVGTANAMDKEELDSLDFIARMIRSGTRPDPTLLVSFIDQQAGDIAPGMGHTSHLLALFDKVDTGYVATYRHVKSGDAKTVEFQRVLDHLDVDGDGIDELILEAWRYGGTPDLVVLGFKANQWHEILRSSSKWCLDPPKNEGQKP